MYRYVLNEVGEPVPEPDLMAWGRWMDQSQKRVVAKTDLPGDVHVSTVFLGLDHNFTGGSPVLWETMIFGGPHGEYQERYTSRADAERGHAVAVALAQSQAADSNV